jgi:hypothetical protein
VTLEALNPLHAGVGDRVAVRVDASLLIRNAAVLTGIPILALAFGWAVSLLIPDSDLFGVPVRFLCIFLSLPLGFAAGLILYRHLSRGNLPVVNRIIPWSR